MKENIILVNAFLYEMCVKFCISYFDTKAEADAYVLDYNKDNTASTAPDYYFQADEPVQV